LSVYWVFGASKPLGNTLARKLAQQFTVITFSRSHISIIGNHVQHFKIDFADNSTLREVITQAIRLYGFPNGVAFCQRYRGGHKTELISELSDGIQVELGPTLALLDSLGNRHKGNSLSIVMFTSVAYEKVNPDIPLNYHILKAATASFVRYQAMALRLLDVKINAIVLGEFLKYSIDSYSFSEKQKYSNLARISNIGRTCTVADVVSLAEFLLVNPSLALNGQLINLEGGVSQLAAEALVRDSLSQTWL
jgi:NAD(P)-dependent dehydrogenase (short-subunit alcohol dehydrogenase family)